MNNNLKSDKVLETTSEIKERITSIENQRERLCCKSPFIKESLSWQKNQQKIAKLTQREGLLRLKLSSIKS